MIWPTALTTVLATSITFETFEWTGSISHLLLSWAQTSCLHYSLFLNPLFIMLFGLEETRNFIVSKTGLTSKIGNDLEITGRERPKSASYLRLKNIQGKIQPIVKFFIYHTVPKNPERVFPETRKVFFCTRKKTNLLLRKIKFF